MTTPPRFSVLAATLYLIMCGACESPLRYDRDNAWDYRSPLYVMPDEGPVGSTVSFSEGEFRFQIPKPAEPNTSTIILRRFDDGPWQLYHTRGKNGAMIFNIPFTGLKRDHVQQFATFYLVADRSSDTVHIPPIEFRYRFPWSLDTCDCAGGTGFRLKSNQTGLFEVDTQTGSGQRIWIRIDSMAVRRLLANGDPESGQVYRSPTPEFRDPVSTGPIRYEIRPWLNGSALPEPLIRTP